MAKAFSDYQAPRPAFGFDPDATAVLVVDMLNDFCEPGGAMELPAGREIYGPLQQLLATCREGGTPVVWVCDEHPSPLDREFEKRTVHCMAGTWGAEIVGALEARPDDFHIRKRRYSGFFETDLDLRLRELQVRHVIATGVAANICVRSTVHDAFFRGYDVIVPRECVAGSDVREEESTLWDIETHYGTVCQLDDVLRVLGATRQAAGT